MKRVPDRKRLRREYLWRNAALYIAMVGLIATILIVACAVSLMPGRLPLTITIPAFILMSLFSGRQWAMIRQIRHKAKQVSYVPPVIPSTLPAEEILVRMAAEPLAPNETLLRATARGEEARAEELLRSHES